MKSVLPEWINLRRKVVCTDDTEASSSMLLLVSSNDDAGRDRRALLPMALARFCYSFLFDLGGTLYSMRKAIQSGKLFREHFVHTLPCHTAVRLIRRIFRCLKQNDVGLIGVVKKDHPNLCGSVQRFLLQFVLLVILLRQKLKRRTTKREREKRPETRFDSHTIQVSCFVGNDVPLQKCLRPSHLVRRKRCTDHVPIRPLDAFNAMPEALSQLSLFPFCRWPIRGQPYCR